MQITYCEDPYTIIIKSLSKSNRRFGDEHTNNNKNPDKDVRSYVVNNLAKRTISFYYFSCKYYHY
eukprot:m.19873 g.19873  ORF g.19873 m.19873 type:complete len:65 (+) comp6694_c0_seq1:248-442(+)